MLRTTLTFAAVAVAAPSFATPLIEAIYQRSEVLDGADQIPGFIPPDLGMGVLGDVVRSNGQGDIRALDNGNFVGRVNTNPQQIGIGAFPGPNSRTAGIHYLFGSDEGGENPRAFLREATIGPDEQLELVGDSGIDNQGNLSYTANLRDPSDPQISTLSSLWENQTAILVEGDQIAAGPLSGEYFNSAGGVYRSPSGVTTWITSYTDTPGAASTGTALMRGTTTFDVLLESGDALPGLGTLEVGGLANIEWSLLGTNYIVKVDVEPGFTSTDEAIAVNGAGIFTDSGGLVREGQTIPAADGGLAGEVWTGFQFLDVNESGDVAFGAFTSGPDGQDDVVMVNGEVRYREGQVLDGVTLSGQVLGVAINDSGDVAIAWNETVFINDTKVAEIGTLVDSDGDGVADAAIDGTGIALGGLEITNQTAAGGDGFPVIYFPGEFNGARDAYFRLVAAAPIPGDFDGDGDVDVDDFGVFVNSFQLSPQGGPPFADGDFDEDGDVDVDDFGVFVNSFQMFPPSGPGIAVPEPGAIGLMLAAFACWTQLARRR